MTTYCCMCKKSLLETDEKYLFCPKCRSFTPNRGNYKGGVANMETENVESSLEIKVEILNKKSFIEMAEKIKLYSDKEFPNLTIEQKLKVNHQYWKLLKQEQKK